MPHTTVAFAQAVGGTRLLIPAGTDLGTFTHTTDEAGVRRCVRNVTEQDQIVELFLHEGALLAQALRALRSAGGRSVDGALTIRRCRR